MGGSRFGLKGSRFDQEIRTQVRKVRGSIMLRFGRFEVQKFPVCSKSNCLILLCFSSFAQLRNLAILDSSFRKEQRGKNLLDFTCSALLNQRFSSPFMLFSQSIYNKFNHQLIGISWSSGLRHQNSNKVILQVCVLILSLAQYFFIKINFS